MITTTRSFRVAMLLGTLFFFGCADLADPTAPGGATPTMTSFAKGGKRADDSSTNDAGTTTTTDESVTVIADRRTPLEADEVGEAVIGIWGGQIMLSKDGVQLYVPPGALTTPTTIRVTALAGSKVAYEFEPHGIRFALPVEIYIRKDVTSTTGSLFGVYYEGDPAGAFSVLEFLPVWENPRWYTLLTDHFSGYALASGGKRSSGSKLTTTNY